MKKFLSLAAAFALAFSFSACHDDDDDEDGYYYADFSNVAAVSYIPGVYKTSAITGVNSYMLSDASGYTDAYCFTTWSVGDTASISSANPLTPGKDLIEGFQGGMCPATISAVTNAGYSTLAPACDSLPSSNTSGYLICCPGSLERALFSKHFAVDITAAFSYLRLKDMQSFCVCPAKAYDDINDELSTSYKSSKIQFVLYGYVSSFNFSSFSKALETIKNAGKNVGTGGDKVTTITLATSDANGKWTVNNAWQKVDVSSDKHYLYEGYLQVVDASGNTVSDAISDENGLNFCCIGDMAYETRF